MVRELMLGATMALCAARVLSAQSGGGHAHTPGMVHTPGMAPSVEAPNEAGNARFAAIAAVVRVLESDPNTDWTKVNVEALRQHLIDMDEVTTRAVVRATPVAGGAAFIVTGTGRTVGAIQRLLTAHSSVLESERGWRGTITSRSDGVEWRVVGKPGATLVKDQVRIRALGAIGVLTVGDHHAVHHLAIARGEAMHRK
jgi:hypothetical protein